MGKIKGLKSLVFCFNHPHKNGLVLLWTGHYQTTPIRHMQKWGWLWIHSFLFKNSTVWGHHRSGIFMAALLLSILIDTVRWNQTGFASKKPWEKGSFFILEKSKGTKGILKEKKIGLLEKGCFISTQGMLGVPEIFVGRCVGLNFSFWRNFDKENGREDCEIVFANLVNFMISVNPTWSFYDTPLEQNSLEHSQEVRQLLVCGL